MGTNWYDNDTDTFFEEGDSVIWQGDDEMTGTLTVITESTFTVLWDDGKSMEYDFLNQDAIKKNNSPLV